MMTDETNGNESNKLLDLEKHTIKLKGVLMNQVAKVDPLGYIAQNYGFMKTA